MFLVNLYFRNFKVRSESERTLKLQTGYAIHILRQHMDWVGWFKKWYFLLTFSFVFMLTDVVGLVQKVQKCDDLINGCTQIYNHSFKYLPK